MFPSIVPSLMMSGARVTGQHLRRALGLIFVAASLLTAQQISAQSAGPDALHPVLDRAVNCFAIQPDGRILLGGIFNFIDQKPSKRLGRLLPDGSVDSSFSSGLPADLGGNVESLTLLPDGKFLVTGSFFSQAAPLQTSLYRSLLRFDADGRLDTNFAPNIHHFPGVPVAALQPDGKILVSTEPDGLLRLKADGSSDETFHPGVKATLITVQSDGRILFVTPPDPTGQPLPIVSRLQPNGSDDPSFHPESALIDVQCLALQPDGKIILGGSFDLAGPPHRAGLARLNSDGNIDPSFNPGVNRKVEVIAAQADGKLLILGGLLLPNGQIQRRIERLNPDGSVDPTFTPALEDVAVIAMAPQADGKLLVGGFFDQVAGQTRHYVARLNSTTPAAQSLNLSPTGVSWLREGTSPEVGFTQFERSADGGQWVDTRAGVQSGNTWRPDDFSVSPSDSVRARGFAAWGKSSGLFQAHAGGVTIVSQPADRTNAAATTASFSVHAEGSSPLTYQWLKGNDPLTNGAKISGSTGPTLTITQVLGIDAGDYHAVVRNGIRDVTSASARLTVLDPYISQSPLPVIRNVGESGTLSVVAAGTPPLEYQWFRDGTEIPGATSSTLTINPVTVANSGSYHVRVANLQGATNSATARVAALVLDGQYAPEANGAVTALAIQPGGKMVVGGEFSAMGPTSAFRLTRLTTGGLVDPSFVAPANGSVYSLVQHPDGGLLVGGSFTTIGSQNRNQIARIGPNDIVDPAFNPGANGLVHTLAVQSDDKILVGGTFTVLGGLARNRLGRLNSDGTIDPNFNPGADGAIRVCAVQADGKILVGGTFSQLGGQARSYLGRLHPDGTVDLSFDAQAGSWGGFYALAVQADGKILVAGNFTTMGGQPRARIGRLNPDGTLDPSFNPGANSWISSLAIQTDGKIIVAGDFTNLGGISRERIGRLNPDGSVDLNFNPGANGWVFALALQNDGNLIVGGSFTVLNGTGRNRIGRLFNSEPAVDALFYEQNTLRWLRSGSGPETLRANFDYAVNGVHWVSAGAAARIAGGWELSGIAVPPGTTFRARGSSTCGQANASAGVIEQYAGPPFVEVPLSPTNPAGTSITLKAVVYGLPSLVYQWLKDGMPLTNNTQISGVTNATLTLTNIFKPNEGAYQVVVRNPYGTTTSLVSRLTIQDPAILAPPRSINRRLGEGVAFTTSAAGTPPLSYQWFYNDQPVPQATNSGLFIVNLSATDAGRYTVRVSNAYGTSLSAPAFLTVNGIEPDRGFRPPITVSNPPYPVEYCLALLPDGKALLGGDFSFMVNNEQRIGLGRFNPDGTPDPTFRSALNQRVVHLAIEPDGKLLAVGNFEPSGLDRIARLDPAGNREPTFKPSVNFEIYAIRRQFDGKILLGGRFSSLNGEPRRFFARLNADGSLDPTFQVDADNFVHALAIRPDGTILVGGAFANIGGKARRNLALVHPDGTVDDTFNPSANDVVMALALQGDGQILVGGSFTMLGGEPRQKLGRLSPTGAVDPSFRPTADSIVLSLLVQTDGCILLTGYFDLVNGQARSGIARINHEGTLDLGFNPPIGNPDAVAIDPQGRLLVAGASTTFQRFNNGEPATHTLTVENGTVTWLRGGPGPEVVSATFESSTNGSHWSLLGPGTRIPGGWRFSGLVPTNTLIRASALANGTPGSQTWCMDVVGTLPMFRITFTQDDSNLFLRWDDVGGPYQVQATTDPGQPASWQALGDWLQTNAAVLPIDSPQRFLRIRR